MHYSQETFRSVRDSDWSADHIARHGVILDEVRQAILKHPYWATQGRDDTTLIYGQTYTGRYLLVVAIPEKDGEAFIVTARDMTDAEEDLPQEGTMTMPHPEEHLPRPAAELDQLADYYDTHDTSADMENGEWVEPGPMVTTSLRLPADVINELKRQAQTRHVRYTTYIRAILERAANGGPPLELADITERLKRIERAVTRDHKTA